jgi:protein gp37
MPTKIEWAQETWNPVTGCNKISEGCQSCYAEKMALRLKSMGIKKYANGFNVICHDNNLLPN